MEKLLYFFTHYGLAAMFLLIALFRRPKSLLGLWAAAAFFASVMLFLFVWGQWPLVGSYYGRLIPVAVVAVVVLSASKASTAGLPVLNRSIMVNTGSVILVGLTGFAGYGVALGYAGRHYPEPVAEIEFPLKNGRYYVSSGGSSPIVNNHMRDFPNPQQYALDLSKLGPLGGASSNILSPDNDNHHIFGEPVYAPCDGRVIDAIGEVADNAGSSMAVAAEDGTGNFVSIDCDGLVVSLVHLKFGSIMVTPDDRVVTGQQMGRVGNSGFSEEPHLHLQATVYNENGRLVGIPMRFAGRTYSRNDIISVSGG